MSELGPTDPGPFCCLGCLLMMVLLGSMAGMGLVVWYFFSGTYSG